MRDIAALAGVSVSTVAAAINGNKYVSPALKARIDSAALQCGYRKRRSSDADESRRSVAVILPGIYSSFFPPLLNGISDVTSSRGMSMTLCDSRRNIRLEAELIDQCVRRGIRNIILDSVCDVRHEESYFSEIRREIIDRKGVNIAVVERRIPDEAFFSIYADNFSASYAAARHLLDCGCRHPAHIGGADMFPHTQVREQAFLQAVRDAGLDFDERLLLRGDFSPLSGFGVVQTLLGRGIAVDGVFAANDQMAIGAMKALSDAGRRIPEDVKVAGFDNLAVSSLVTPGLTTVQFPIYQMGYQAAHALAETLDGKNPMHDILLPSRLIVRGSTVAGAPADRNLQDW